MGPDERKSMDIFVNGSAANLDLEGRTLAELLGELDERLEAAGSIIIAIALNGQNIAPEALPGLASTVVSGPGRLDIHAESSSSMRASAMRTLLEFLDAVAQSDGAELGSIRDTFERYRGAFSGLYSAEEESFLVALSEDLASGPAALQLSLPKLRSFFSERLSELEDPVASMKGAARLFQAIKGDLKEVPVRMQTGKDAEAMRSMMLTVELINKTVRLLPEFTKTLGAAADMAIAGQSWEDFFNGFNDILRELAGAFENKDGVLIGDLAEYEIVPRLEALFSATEEAIGTP
jgi:hypothetical protein